MHFVSAPTFGALTNIFIHSANQKDVASNSFASGSGNAWRNIKMNLPSGKLCARVPFFFAAFETFDNYRFEISAVIKIQSRESAALILKLAELESCLEFCASRLRLRYP